VPLLNSDPHLKVTQALQHLDKSLQRRVALLVEATVGKKLVDRVLLASKLHDFEQLEQTLCDKQLAVVFVVQVHLLPFTGDFSHAVVVSPVQVLHFSHKIIAFNTQAVKADLDIMAVGMIVGFLAL
jgi:hypothetical protein